MMLPLQDEATRQAGKEGRHAARELHKNARKAFEYWETIGNSMLQFRAWAMKQAGVQQLTSKMGSRYNYWFGKILNDYEMGPDPIETKSGRRIPGLIKDGDRSILMNKVMPNIEAIKAWRNAQPETERLRLNYPTTVHQKWLAAKKLAEALASGTPLPDDSETIAGSSGASKSPGQPHVPTMLGPDEKPEKVAPYKMLAEQLNNNFRERAPYETRSGDYFLRDARRG